MLAQALMGSLLAKDENPTESSYRGVRDEL
jgi:hypothetical protein